MTLRCFSDDVLQGIDEVGRDKMASISFVKLLLVRSIHLDEGMGTSRSKAGRGIAPGSLRSRDACW